ncbi:ALBINO3-like protein 3, mitochondrial isoform X3 [Amaranthus tricolor]|uniref:ALBINO3-like protein 3, mitochondrial isoform X3 n=1 Tax=Amaranthus tricolor TaxID=29722 RepID=UPI00258AA36D|nr:ALBINO3-like protein 3, mitochondrial isoform X3 [Amaranthus tricolor]
MATSGIISAYLRRSKLSLLRPTIISLSSSSPLPTTSNSTLPLFSRHTTSFRYFSAQPSDSDFTHQLNSVTESELRSLGYIDGSQVSDAAGTLLDDLHLPIRCVVSLLDGYHDLTGLPWWIVIASSTVAMRITLSPWILLQLHKLRQIGEVFPKLPPPFPPPFSGRSFVNQFSLFWRKRRELGCPSFLWFVASITVQLPCFLLWMTSIRKMSLDQHPGFDTGGILWFQNLTEVSNGPFGLILPVLIAGLHFCNIQVSFRSVSAVQGEETFHLLAKLYKKYLELLTLPILIVGFYIPQGSLVYWVTNSSLSLVQQSVAHLSAGRVDRALPLLRVALSKDPEYYIALTVLGQAMLQLKDYDEAVEYLECALSKISLRDPTDAEALDYFIQASMSAGAAYYHQGKLAESFAHFERIRDIEVPEEPTAKARYYEGLMVFSSFLINEGRKDEATHYLRMAAAYDPQYAVYLEHLDKVRDNFVSDLASSRRADY